MASNRRVTGYRAAAVLLVGVGVGGVDLASGAGEETGPLAAASATRIGTKQIKDGSLLYKDFKRGELTKRFATVGRVAAIDEDLTRQRAELAKHADELSRLSDMPLKWSQALLDASSNELALEKLEIAHEGSVLDGEHTKERVAELEAGRGAGILTLESGRGELLLLPGLLALDGESGQSPRLHLISKGPALEAVVTSAQGSTAHSVPAGGANEIALPPGTQVVDLQVTAGKHVIRIHTTLTDLSAGAYRFVASSTSTPAG